MKPILKGILLDNGGDANKIGKKENCSLKVDYVRAVITLDLKKNIVNVRIASYILKNLSSLRMLNRLNVIAVVLLKLKKKLFLPKKLENTFRIKPTCLLG